MLIKPWNETPAPRHTFEEFEDENVLVPSVTVDLGDVKGGKYVLVVPHNIGVVAKSLDSVEIGSVNIEYQKDELPKDESSKEAEEDDYDEDEQLYHAISSRSLQDKYAATRVPICASGNTISVVVPHFTNTITHNVFARVLVESVNAALPGAVWITLSPCAHNTSHTLNQLGPNREIADKFAVLASVPALKPPHFITGIGAAVVSEVNRSQCSSVALVLHAEGQPGYEKVDTDALVDAAYALSDITAPNHKETYLKKVSLAVRKFNSYSNSGIYL